MSTLPQSRSRRISAREKADQVGREVLLVLSTASKPLSVSEIAKSGGLIFDFWISSALKRLYKKGFVASTSGKWNILQASAEMDSYSITPAGRRSLDMGLQSQR